MKKKNNLLIYSFAIIVIFLMLSNSCKKDDNSNTGNTSTVKDIDGNIYHTIKIGTQVWMVENLKVTHYCNGDAIPLATTWSYPDTGVYCNYENDDNNSKIYGRLYNFYATQDSRNIAPVGWHVPTLWELEDLFSSLGGEYYAGGKLKEKGITHWDTPNTGATNESGFTALPGGSVNSLGEFNGLGNTGQWWSSTYGGAGTGNCMNIHYNSQIGEIPWGAKVCGFSIRCLKD